MPVKEKFPTHLENMCFVTDKEGMLMQTVCTFLIILLRIVLFKIDQLHNQKDVFSKANLKQLVIGYLSVSVSVSLNVIFTYLLARYLSSSECEWFLLIYIFEYLVQTLCRLSLNVSFIYVITPTNSRATALFPGAIG